MIDAPGYRPLYQQVREMFLRRIADQTWQPGEMLPSEQALAQEVGVSQGTVRKALDALAAENLVERRQGKGTYVAEVTAERSLFQFFRISRPGGERVTPGSGDADVEQRAATGDERRLLELEAGSEVITVVRPRLVDGSPSILEKIAVPAARFPDLLEKELPNALYAIYHSDYGINVLAANEELRAVAASPSDAAKLGLAAGAPILSIERVAYDIDGVPVEIRQSLCDTRHLVYAVTLR